MATNKDDQQLIYILENLKEDLTEIKSDVKEVRQKVEKIQTEEIPHLKISHASLATKTKVYVGLVSAGAGFLGTLLLMGLKFLITGTL